MYRILPALIALVLLGALPSRVGAGVDAFRLKMEKWVETQQIISEERADWQAEKEILESTAELLRKEKEALLAEKLELEETSTSADDERRDLLLERADYQRAGALLEASIRHMEEAVLELAPRLPKPLQKKLEPLLVRIPVEAESASQPLGQRLMNVLGVLAQAEKWNGTATLAGETRALGGDKKIQVRTLYWGLAQAIYADTQGRSAGIGRPAGGSWEFSDDASLAADANLFLDIYEGNVDVIQFVDLPASLGDASR